MFRIKRLNNISAEMQEMDFLENEEVEISDDVYNLTIAANISRECHPLEFYFCLRQCFVVFIFQIVLSYFDMFENFFTTNFQDFKFFHSFFRLLSPVLF
jgi:hypothetical protein